MELTLQENEGLENKTVAMGSPEGATLLITPPVGEGYWTFRVAVAEDDSQAIIALPKFLTIGVGFEQEEDWNTNLPYSSGPDEIWNHIKHNKGDESIPDERCIEAIRMVVKAASELDA